jgi:hypothetical protein
MKHLESQLRLGTGLILALYVVQHLVNHAFGIVSIEIGSPAAIQTDRTRINLWLS